MEDGLAQGLVQVGIRAATGDQRANARRHGSRLIEMKDFADGLVLEFARPLYITFDMDALDPAFAPGVSHHEPGGLSTRQVLDLIHRLKADIIGLDVVECNPTRDPSGITAAAAVKIIKEVAGRMIAGSVAAGVEAQSLMAPGSAATIFSSHSRSTSEKASRVLLSTSRTAHTSGRPAKSGTTISDADRLSQAMWPGNLWTSGTTTVSRRLTAAQQTPWFFARTGQARAPW